MRLLRIRQPWALAAAGVLASLSFALPGAPANAANVYHINGWLQSGCSSRGEWYCLWHLSGKGTGGAGWGWIGTSFINLNAQQSFFLCGNPPPGGPQGCGQTVWHDAQSMSNGTPNCNVTVWQFTNSQGDTDWLSPGWGGNLTSTVSDHDESISANHCT